MFSNHLFLQRKPLKYALASLSLDMVFENHLKNKLGCSFILTIIFHCNMVESLHIIILIKAPDDQLDKRLTF